MESNNFLCILLFVPDNQPQLVTFSSSSMVSASSSTSFAASVSVTISFCLACNWCGRKHQKKECITLTETPNNTLISSLISSSFWFCLANLLIFCWSWRVRTSQYRWKSHCAVCSLICRHMNLNWWNTSSEMWMSLSGTFSPVILMALKQRKNQVLSVLLSFFCISQLLLTCMLFHIFALDVEHLQEKIRLVN